MDEGQKILRHTHDDGISGADIVQFVTSQFWWIAAFLVAGAVLGIAYSFTKAHQWEAATFVQIGQIDELGSGSAPIDTPNRAVQRVQVDPFIDQVLRSQSLPTQIGENSESDLIRRTLSAEIVPNSDVIKLTVRGLSPQKADATLQAAQNQLIGIHAGIVEAALKRTHDRLDTINAAIADAQSKRAGVASTASTRANSGAGDSGVTNVLLGNILDVSDRTLLVKLGEERALALLQLSPQHTFNTKPLAAIAVSQLPVYPKRSTFALFGAVVGGLIGVLVAARRHAKRG
ncbi:Wzz/FepE/Etk N-terminal domain-containing protein [Paraburkholderia sp. A2WS-5]|uniref:Wzz/FepE/Etk N-terminal domain-containing protein n=1 Tax=Paraburkholderia sp. A2WS-5 TaxID=3028372 RepID=UPI003B792E12